MMNYREEVIVEKELLNRLAIGHRQASQLSDELSRMDIVPVDRQGSGVGFLSRIKSTIFSSQDAGVRCAFVASCKIISESGLCDSYVGVKENGSCVLLRVDTRSGRSATEVTALSLPASREGYCVSAVALGRTQGSLCAVSAGDGRIYLLTVKGDLMGMKKNITLPVTAPITGLFLSERNGLIELFVILEKTHIVVIPDITKSTEYFFVYTKSLKNRIKLSEYASITEESLQAAWARRHTAAAPERSYLKTSVLLSSKLNSITSFHEFRSIYLHEKSVELLLIRQPSAVVSSLVRSDSLTTVVSRITGSVSSYESLVDLEAERLENALGFDKVSFEISDIFFDEISGKIIIYFADGHLSEIVPTDSVLERYLNTFLSAPFVFRFLNKRLSRDSVLNLFGATKEWVNLFASASVAEAVGSSFLEPMATDLIKQRLDSNVVGEVKDHVDSCLDIISYVSKEQRMEMICSLITGELNHLDLSTLGGSEGILFAQALATTVSNLVRVTKYYLAYAVYSSSTVRGDIAQSLGKLSILHHLFTHYQLAGPLSREHVVGRCKARTVSDLLGKLEIIFCAPNHFSVEVGYLAATTDILVHSGLRNFHTARILACSPSAEDRNRAWEMIKAGETEMSLFSEYIKPSSTAVGSPVAIYYQTILPWFAQDYEHESQVLKKLSALTGSESFQKLLIEKAIAKGDWERTRELLDSIPKSQNEFKQYVVRLVCAEARIRNELGSIFDILKSNKDVISLIVAEIESEIDNIADSEPLYMQIYSLCVFVEDFSGAAKAMLRWYNSLLCPYTNPEKHHQSTLRMEFDYIEVRKRLEVQLKALLLCRAVAINNANDIKKRIVVCEGLIAALCFINDGSDLEDEYGAGLSVSRLCRTLSALGLPMLSFDIARRFRLDLFKSCVCPLIELIIKCEDDATHLPPCRWALDESKSSVLMPEVLPAMAFVRSDASGPVRSGGSQLRAIVKALEYILRRANARTVTLSAAEYIFLIRNREKLYSFLIDILETQNGWTDLLKLHMRKEQYGDCVRLVETHLKYWRPAPTSPPSEGMMINVPLLVQLQRALRMAAIESEELSHLSIKLDATLEGVKTTLAELSSRLI